MKLLYSVIPLRNWEMLDSIKPTKIKCIFDNDKQKWNTQKNGIDILEPKSIDEDIAVISAVEDYAHLISQLKKLQFKKVIFAMRDGSYNNTYREVIALIKNKKPVNRLKEKDQFEYVHIISDQKFIIPVVDILESHSDRCPEFDIRRHAFIVSGFNIYNKKDHYHIWDKYIELMDTYQNIVIVDSILDSGGFSAKEILETTRQALNYCKEIIFHGEWMIDEVCRMKSNNMDCLIILFFLSYLGISINDFFG